MLSTWGIALPWPYNLQQGHCSSLVVSSRLLGAHTGLQPAPLWPEETVGQGCSWGVRADELMLPPSLKLPKSPASSPRCCHFPSSEGTGEHRNKKIKKRKKSPCGDKHEQHGCEPRHHSPTLGTRSGRMHGPFGQTCKGGRPFFPATALFCRT